MERTLRSAAAGVMLVHWQEVLSAIGGYFGGESGVTHPLVRGIFVPKREISGQCARSSRSLIALGLLLRPLGRQHWLLGAGIDGGVGRHVGGFGVSRIWVESPDGRCQRQS